MAFHRRRHLSGTSSEDARKISMSLPLPAMSRRLRSESSIGKVTTVHSRTETWRTMSVYTETTQDHNYSRYLALKVFPDEDEENALRDNRYVCSALAWETRGAQKPTWAGLNAFPLNDCQRALSRYSDDVIDTIQRANNTCITGM